jgi:hypothetical protein
VRSFSCVCGQTLSFENSVCLNCGRAVGYSRAERDMRPLDGLSPCVNLNLNGCNWIPDVADEQCFACDLTRTRPNDEDLEGMPQYYRAEQAKRRLLYELDRIGLPVEPYDSAGGRGLAFDLLSSVAENVTTGHADGIVTLDLAEGDAVHREQVRLDLDEAYRTLLGHFRHEIGHYYWTVLVESGGDLAAFREVFGDERESYADAVSRHYSEGPPSGWEEHHVSAYATMHPWEDFAETFAHVLHIRDALETAHETGLSVDPQLAMRDFGDVVVGTWVPLSAALNQMNRSLGHGDLYPFVLAPAVVDKMVWVDALLRRFPDMSRSGPR